MQLRCGVVGAARRSSRQPKSFLSRQPAIDALPRNAADAHTWGPADRETGAGGCALTGAGGTGCQAMRRNFLPQAPEGLAVLLALLVALGLSVNAAVGLWIGFHDALWPVGLSAQFVGLFYFTAGVVSLAGLVAIFPLLGKVLDQTGQPSSGRAGHSRLLALITQNGDSSTRPLAFVAAAAAAGLYIDLIIVFYSFDYRTRYAWMFGALALLCACVACATLPVSWSYLGKGLKAVGISLTVLASAAYFWYQSVYIPENNTSGIYYDLTLGSIVRSGSDRLVSVHLTMENESSVTALTLGSIVVVNGMYPTQKSRILRILTPIDDDSFLFPNATYSDAFLVQVPDPGIESLQFMITLWSTRITGLTLGNPIRMREHLQSCPDGTLLEWPIEEGELRSFTEGAQVLYSDWCGDSKNPGGPSTNAWMGTPATTRPSLTVTRAFAKQVDRSFGDYTFPLGAGSNP